MKKVVLAAWLLIPVIGAAYHFGPGQEKLRLDEAASAVARADAAAASARELAATSGDAAARTQWAEADAAYSEALALLPGDRVEQGRTLRLERAKAQMFVSKLPEARRDLESLVDEISGDAKPNAQQLDAARTALANAQFYTTWLMRLEGAPSEEWQTEIDAARQNYKLVAEHAEKDGDAKSAERARKDLESSIRLARLDLTDLQGAPLPSQ